MSQEPLEAITYPLTDLPIPRPTWWEVEVGDPVEYGERYYETWQGFVYRKPRASGSVWYMCILRR
jgi:hypothetical protein